MQAGQKDPTESLQKILKVVLSVLKFKYRTDSAVLVRYL